MKPTKTKFKYVAKRLFELYLRVVSTILLFFSIAVLFVNWDQTDEKCKYVVLAILIAVLLLIFVGMTLFMLYRVKVELNVNGTNVKVRVGDVLSADSQAIKVIHCNEYFDTELGDIISENTLHGKYLKKYYTNVADLNDLDSRIAQTLQNGRVDKSRKSGKQTKYKLGELFVDKNNFVLLAFSRFDADNRAFIDPGDYWNCLVNMWENLDKIYAGNKIVLTVFGVGMTRFGNHERLNVQFALEMMLMSLRLVRKSFKGGIEILLSQEAIKQVNLQSLK